MGVDSHQTHSRHAWLDTISRIWAWLFLLAMVIFFSLAGEGFFTAFNLQAILANMAILTIIAMGQTYVIISGGIDLSAGWVMGMAAVISATVMNRLPETTPMWMVVLSGLGVGLVAAWIAGLVNGILIARLNVPPFIATLGMFGIARGIGFLLSGGMPVPIYIKGLGFLGNGFLIYYHPSAGWSLLAPPAGLAQADLRNLTGYFPFVVIVMLALLLVAHLVLSRTKFGLHTYAIGGNKEAAMRAGIPVARRLVSIYMLSATFAAIAGLVYNVRFTNGAANAGEAMLLDTVAAVVIGGASLFGGAGTVIGTLIGALIISVLANGLVIMRVNPFWQFIAVGIVIIIAVLIDQARAQFAQE
ncbi:MAG TPA: ribose ABC transporter [Chloroflexi bacterium]|nr:ribose ABC transporter [Chloroflexota bacterium]HHW88463.1 ABC transporter permease [Chloroflexota bacterium]